MNKRNGNIKLLDLKKLLSVEKLYFGKTICDMSMILDAFPLPGSRIFCGSGSGQPKMCGLGIRNIFSSSFLGILCRGEETVLSGGAG